MRPELRGQAALRGAVATRRQRGARLVAAFALATVPAAQPMSARADGPDASCWARTVDGPFVRVLAPERANVIDYAVDTLRPRRIFLTDGASIFRTRDGGCTWDDVFRVSEVSGGVGFAEKVHNIVVTPAGPGRRSLVYAVLSKCVAQSSLVGCAILVSDDDGETWTRRIAPTGAGDIRRLVVAPSDPRFVYIVANAPHVGHERQTVEKAGPTLYASADAGETWELRDSHLEPSRLRSFDVTEVPPLAVDPVDRDHLWSSAANHAMRSTDGGRTWREVPGSPGPLVSIVVDRQPGARPVVTVATTGAVWRSLDGGGTWRALNGSPGDIRSLATGGRPGYVVVTARHGGQGDGTPTDLASVYVHAPAVGWLPVTTNFHDQFSAASSDQVKPVGAFYFRDGVLPGILVYTPPVLRAPAKRRPPPVSEVDGSADACSVEPDPAPAVAPPGSEVVTPMPVTDSHLYVSNFFSGCVVRFDRLGKAKAVLRVPPKAEGITLTFDRQLVITTRYSNTVTLSRFPAQRYDTIDPTRIYAEGPAFDRFGNLYVVGNKRYQNNVFMYPYPQYPGQVPELVWSFGGYHFLEDVRIAPPASPFAGKLFVQYSTLTMATNGAATDAVAVLERTPTGWRRLPDFCKFPAGFVSLGMQFQPDGSLLVPEYSGSPTRSIHKYSPDGKTLSTFAELGSGPEKLQKIDVSASGHVYVVGAREGGHGRVFRFDSAGNRLYPDFTAGLGAYPVGIAVNNVITGLPPLIKKAPPPLSRREPRRGAVAPAPPQQPMPPVPVAPVPVAAPGPVPVPVPAPAPGGAAAAQAQPQAQANPVAQAQPVPQLAAALELEQRVQVAVAEVNAQPAQEHLMTKYRPDGSSRQRPGAAAVGAAAVTLLACAAAFGTRPHPLEAPARCAVWPRRARGARTRLRQ